MRTDGSGAANSGQRHSEAKRIKALRADRSHKPGNARWVVPTMICQSLTTWAAKHAEPSMMAMFPVLQPVASASLSWILRLA
eukprot:s594_g1.t1